MNLKSFRIVCYSHTASKYCKRHKIENKYFKQDKAAVGRRVAETFSLNNVHFTLHLYILLIHNLSAKHKHFLFKEIKDLPFYTNHLIDDRKRH